MNANEYVWIYNETQDDVPVEARRENAKRESIVLAYMVKCVGVKDRIKEEGVGEVREE